MERDSRTRDGQRENEGEGAEEREKEREKEIAREREMESDRFSVSSGKWKSVCVCACMRVCHVTQVDTGDYMKLQTCDIRLHSLGTRRKQKKTRKHTRKNMRARAHTHTYIQTITGSASPQACFQSDAGPQHRSKNRPPIPFHLQIACRLRHPMICMCEFECTHTF